MSMNFIASSTSLLKHLQSISGVLNTSNTLPILDNFLFEITNGQLTASASDLETTMVTKMDVHSEEDGKIAIPAKLLLDVLKSLPDQPCTFKVNASNYQIEIAYDNGKSRMVGFNGDEFPKIPELAGKSAIKLSGDILSRAINKTLFASGNDDLRPVMSGVFCQFSASEITFVATDAHKLVRFRRTDAEASGSSAFILPKKPLNILKSILGASDAEVKIEYNDSNATFSFDNYLLMCRLIDGKYPNYEAVIPKENPNKLMIDRSQFLSSVRRVAIFSNKTTHQIRLKIAGAELNISAEDIDYSNKADERLTCDYQGDDMQIGFNSRFLTEMLSNLTSDEIQLEMSMPNRAGILTPVDGLDEGETVTMLVMPVMLSN